MDLRISTNTNDCYQEGSGACELVVTAENYWEMLSSPTTQTYNVDLSPPVTSFDGWWGRAVVYSGADGRNWFDDSVEFTIDCADPHSGCDVIWWRTRATDAYASQEVDGTSTNYTFTESRTDAGSEVELSFYADDNALSEPGNTESPNSVPSVWIDGRAPETTIDPVNEWVTGDSLSIDIGCTDIGGSGCANIEYDDSNIGSDDTDCSYNKNEPVSGESDGFSISGVSFCADGDTCEFSVCARSTDNVGHTDASPASFTFSIDRTDPTVSIFSYDPAPRSTTGPNTLPPGATDNWFNQNFEITATFEDTGSGVADCEYRVIDSAAGETKGWTDIGCSGDASVGTTGDRSQTLTFEEITVGSGADCRTQGRDTCRIEVRAFDAVGNEMDPYSSETVSIDYTQPTCELIETYYEGLGPNTVDDGYQDYNNTLKRHLYMNDNPYDASYTGDGEFEVRVGFDDTNSGAFAGDQVSGIMQTVLPVITSLGDTDDLDMTSGAYPTYQHDHVYSFNGSSAESGTFTVDVTDEAGNTNTCSFDVINVGPGDIVVDDINFTYAHTSFENPTDGGFNADFEIDIEAHSTVLGIAVGPAQIRMLNVSGTSASYLAECDPFDYTGLDPRGSPIIHQDTGLYSSDPSDTAVQPGLHNVFSTAGGGRCFQPYLVINSSIGYLTVIDPSDWSGDGTTEPDAVFALDADPGVTAEEACGFFGTFDNCNNRSQYVNGLPVDQWLVTSCGGSCVQGDVIRASNGNDYANSPVSALPGTKDGYSDVSSSVAPVGRYELFNLTTAPGGRPFEIEAAPTSLDFTLGPKRIQFSIDSTGADPTVPSFPQVHENKDILLGFRPSDCRSDCTLESDPGFGTCRLDCFGINGCGINSSAQPDPEQEAILDVCNGYRRGAITDNGTHIVRCCTAPATGDVGGFAAEFEVNASEVVRSERLVYLAGKLVKLVVVTFEPE